MSSIARIIQREAVTYVDTTEEGWAITYVPTDGGETFVYRRDLGGNWVTNWRDGWMPLPVGCPAWKQSEAILASVGIGLGA